MSAASKIIIAIDGFSSCGKSTLAKELAVSLGYSYIDSGAMYRAITLYFLRQGVNLEDKAAIAEALNSITLTFEYNPSAGKSDIFVNGENVEPYIRDLIVAEKVSEVAAIKEVRTFAVAQQQLMGTRRGIVMDGRDIGTVVFPDAELKIFMTADPEIRVKRRYEELIQNDTSINIEDVMHNLQMRDYIDSNREESPLRQAEDAVILDNTHLTREKQLEKVMQWVKDRSPMVDAG
jgi:cytidylate kinase